MHKSTLRLSAIFVAGFLVHGAIVSTFADDSKAPLDDRPPEKTGSIYSAPIVTTDCIFLATAEGTVYALAVDTGKVRWQYRPSATSNLYSSPATDGTRIFVKSRPKDDKVGENAIFAIGPDERNPKSDAPSGK